MVVESFDMSDQQVDGNRLCLLLMFVVCCLLFVVCRLLWKVSFVDRRMQIELLHIALANRFEDLMPTADSSLIC